MRSKTADLPKHLAILIFGLLGSGTIAAQTPHPSSLKVESMGRVKGTVMDANGAVMVTPRPSIIFEGKNSVRTVTANDSGDYDISLPAGVYKVTTEIAGFYPFRRAEFRLLPGTDVMINLAPTPRYLVRGTTVSASRSVDKLTPSPKYNEFPGPRGSLLIQFQEKRRANRNIEYEGAILTYDALTIYSDKLSFNKTRLRLKASGKRVVVEDGKQRVHVKQASVAFKEGEPVLEVTK